MENKFFFSNIPELYAKMLRTFYLTSFFLIFAQKYCVLYEILRIKYLLEPWANDVILTFFLFFCTGAFCGGRVLCLIALVILFIACYALVSRI